MFMESSYFRCKLVGGRQKVHRFLSKVKKNKDGLLQNSFSQGTSALEVSTQKRKEPVIQMSSANTENVSQTTLPQ